MNSPELPELDAADLLAGINPMFDWLFGLSDENPDAGGLAFTPPERETEGGT